MFLGFLLGKICCKTTEPKSENSEKMIESIICDAEKFSLDNKLFVTKSRFYNQTLTNAYTKSDEYSFSGNYSVKLQGKQPYGMTYRLMDLQTGEHFKFSINRLSAHGGGLLVISAENIKDFYLADSEAKPIDKGDWGRIEIDFIVPEILNGKRVGIYPWNPDTIVPVYFDDLEIRYLGFVKDSIIDKKND